MAAVLARNIVHCFNDQMITSESRPWWHLVPVLPMFLPIPILPLGMVKQVYDLMRHAQHLHQQK